MRYTTWTILPILSLITNTVSSNDQPTTDKYFLEALEQLKTQLRETAPQRTVYNSIPHLNKTIEEKRQMRRQYREKLKELNELDEHMDYNTKLNIHQRDLHTYTASDGGAQAGVYQFPVKIAQPTDHRHETKVQSAILKLYRRASLSSARKQEMAKMPAKRNVGYNTVLLVYQTLPGNMRRLVTSKVVSLARSDWIKIDVTEIAQSWVDEPGMNYGLEVECTSQNISHILELSADSSHQPTLDILTYEKTISVRRKRRDAPAEESCARDRCCRQPVTISYKEAGLHDDLIHEGNETLTAYLCTGRCPKGHRLHNQWSRIKNTLRTVYPNETNYKTRCAPVEFEEFSSLHFDEEGELMATLHNDIIVKECACV